MFFTSCTNASRFMSPSIFLYHFFTSIDPRDYIVLYQPVNHPLVFPFFSLSAHWFYHLLIFFTNFHPYFQMEGTVSPFSLIAVKNQITDFLKREKIASLKIITVINNQDWLKFLLNKQCPPCPAMNEIWEWKVKYSKDNFLPLILNGLSMTKTPFHTTKRSTGRSLMSLPS